MIVELEEGQRMIASWNVRRQKAWFVEVGLTALLLRCLHDLREVVKKTDDGENISVRT